MSDKHQIVPVGENELRLWGLTPLMRLQRMVSGSEDDLVHETHPSEAIVVNLDFVFDPAWLATIKASPRTVLTLENKPVLANCPDHASRSVVEQAMRDGSEIATEELTVLPFEIAAAKTNDELRKRDRPFVGRLTSDNVRTFERASYYSAYKGVTDILTKYLWPEWALALTRIASKFGISPNTVTTVGAVFCLLATWLFFTGAYWAGMGCGLVFMVLDTVDGKLARCTLTSSKFGEFFDHGIDLVHPPFWYYAWAVGLVQYGRPFDDATCIILMVAIVAGYIVQRLVEGAFIAAFGMHVHVWRKFDSFFRLITARRNPNMVILFAGLLFYRPDIGLIAVAIWTWLSLVVHLAQLIHAFIYRAAGKPVVSWLT
jgi:phosphatidylglycerophosphate synthase